MKNIAKVITVFGAIAIATSAFASDIISKDERAKAAEALSKVNGSPVDPGAIHGTSLPGVFEVILPSGPVYVAKDASWVLRGDLVDVAKNENLNQKAIAEMQKVVFSDIPLDNAIKVVIGNGSRKLVTFEDPSCGYCKKFAETLQSITNVTAYIQPVAMISPASAGKVVNVLCSDKPAVAWNELMIKGKDPAECKPGARKEASEKKMKAIQAVAQKFFINGTPSMIFEDNTRVNGLVPLTDLENRLTQASKAVLVKK